MTNIVFNNITIISGVYDINVSAVNILGKSLQRNVEGNKCFNYYCTNKTIRLVNIDLISTTLPGKI